MALVSLYEHLLVRQRGVRLLGKAEDLPQADAKRPDVREGRELVLPQCLGCSPPDGNRLVFVPVVHIVLAEILRQTKVRDLHVQVLIDETVSGGHVSVHKMFFGEVHQTFSHLLRHAELHISVDVMFRSGTPGPFVIRIRMVNLKELLQITLSHVL